MSFRAFQLYLFCTFLRPIELFAQWLVPYRPMLILWLFAFAASVIQAFREKQVATPQLFYWLLLGLTAAIGLSLVFSGWAGGAIAAISDFSAPALLFVLMSLNLTSVERLRSACYTILLSMGILCVAGVNAYHTGYMSEELVLQQRKDDDVIGSLAERPAVPANDQSGLYMWRVRGVGVFNDPNDFAQTIVMSMPMLWFFYRRDRPVRSLLRIALPGALLGYTVFLTNSRGALLGMGSLLFFGVRSVLGTAKTVLLIGAMSAGAMVANMTGGRGFSSKEESAGQRIEAWFEGVKMLKSSPLFGIGYGKFTDHHYLTAHNSFVLCFAELGMLGYFFWIALLVVSYKAVSRAAQFSPIDSNERLVGAVLRSSFIGYLTCAWFLSRTYQSTLYVLMALCAASLYCARKSEGLNMESPLGAPLKWVGSTFLMMIMSFAAVNFFIIMHN